ncbi:uncharacterized protein LOC6557136 isoform X7 [Drosophila grimshawi]|uniref:uncharacterized protein LOC6557136 isoform X7 n=1 Tax=Drosophila grimshawi TaxID=7222 RepID=UPI001C9362B1|nr:uncharacterized protein LOC6557136 isoform X7 [Drosophila grimshawi]
MADNQLKAMARPRRPMAAIIRMCPVVLCSPVLCRRNSPVVIQALILHNSQMVIRAQHHHSNQMVIRAQRHHSNQVVIRDQRHHSNQVVIRAQIPQLLVLVPAVPLAVRPPSTLWASACHQECKLQIITKTTIPQNKNQQHAILLLPQLLSSCKNFVFYTNTCYITIKRTIPKKPRPQQALIIHPTTNVDPVHQDPAICRLHIIACHPAIMMHRRSNNKTKLVKI